MTRTPINALRALLTAAAFALIAAAPASAAELSLARTPAPPESVVNDGNDFLRWNSSVTFMGTSPMRLTYDVRAGEDCAAPASTNPRPSWYTAGQQEINLTGQAGQASYSTGLMALTIPNGAAPGRYYLVTRYYDSIGMANCDSAAFDLAQATGQIEMVSYHDLNGDGTRQPNEPGLSGWDWQMFAPAINGINRDRYDYKTSGDGSVQPSVSKAPTGDYQLAELLPNPNPENWTLTTPASTGFTLHAGETKRVQVGQLKPTSLCGHVFVDVNNNAAIDAADKTFAGVAVRLDGRTGLGAAVGNSTTTDATGAYCFTGLMPGSYQVTETLPADYVPTFDRDGAGNGLNVITPITLVSGTPSADNDFALAQVIRIPQTKLCLTKKADRKSVRQGGQVRWTLKVRNCGTAPARQATVNDPLLASTTLGKHTGATLVRGELIWRAGDLKVGETRTFTFTVRFDRDARRGTHTNRATASAANAATVKAQASVKITATKRKPKVIAVTG